MAQEREQGQKDSVDYVNNALNLGQNALGGGKNLGVGRLASGAARVAAFFTGPVGITIILITVIPFLLVTVLGDQAAGGNTTPAPNETSINTTKTNLNVHFYCQYQNTWTTNICNIASLGCDPTSLAMIFASYGDAQWTPTYTATNNGYMGCGLNCNRNIEFCGTTKQQTINAINNARSLGYTSGVSLAEGRNFDLNQAKLYIENGYLILGGADVYFHSSASLDNPSISSGGHSFVITGVDPVSQTITVLDPTFCTSDTNYVTRTINVNSDVLSGGWFFAFPMKKITLVQ